MKRVARCGLRRLLRGVLVGAVAGCCAFGVAAAQTLDFQRVAQAFGEAHQPLLHGELTATARPLRLDPTAPVEPQTLMTQWPAYVHDAQSFSRHVFTLEELRALQRVDESGLRQLFAAPQMFTVRGLLRRAPDVAQTAQPAQTASVARLVIPGVDDFHLELAGPALDLPNALPADGQPVRLRGQLRQGRHGLPSEPLLLEVRQVWPVDQLDTTAPDPSRLRFVPSDAVRQSLARHLSHVRAAAYLHDSAGESGAALRRAIASGQPQARFAALLAAHGLAANDLADVLAAYLVRAWLIVHEQDPDALPGGVIPLRDGLRHSLARAAWLHALSDAQKQTLAETLIISSQFTADRHTTAKARKDADTLARAVAGIDLRRYRLTADGLRLR